MRLIIRGISFACRLLVIKILPIKKNRLVFTSYLGQYTDSPRYVSEQLHKLCKDLDIIWLVTPQTMNSLPDYVKGVEINSLKSIWALGTAHVLVDNVYGQKSNDLTGNDFLSFLIFKILNFLKSKKSQLVFTTWHGTPIKCMSRDQHGNHFFDFWGNNITMLLGNKYTSDIMRHITFEKVRIESLGSPRNDLLFYTGTAQAETIRRKLKLPDKKKIILYAPTFRNDGPDTKDKNVRRSGLEQLQNLDFSTMFQTLSEYFGGEWVFVCRFHYHVSTMVDWESLQTAYPEQILNGNNYGGMEEYLLCTDILLTDASSCMFDFALTKRPCFIYFPDLAHYRDSERGFYRPIESLPFPVAEDFKELINAMKNFNDKAYRLAVEKMIDEFGYVDDAESSKRVAQFILKEGKLK